MMRFFSLILCLAFVVAGIPLPTAAAWDHVRGRILIDVEQDGEAWYVMPTTYQRYYLGRPDDAFALMRTLSLGISDADLATIPRVEDDWEGNVTLRNRLAGRLLLQVEQYGEVWYVNPINKKRYFLGRPADAFRIMRELGLGITHANLQTIPQATVIAPLVVHRVPFAAQAPFGEWDDPRQGEGCEEASVLMAVTWARGGSLSKEEAKRQVIAISEYEERMYGEYRDTSVQDTADRIVRGYFGYDRIRVEQGIDVQDVAWELEKGNVVLVGANGQVLQNPYYTPPGPLQHMIVVVGYDPFTDTFITHDPGTRWGEGARYSAKRLQEALLDYPTGYREPFDPNRTGMIVVETRQ